MNLEDAGDILIAHFPQLAGRDKAEVARAFFGSNPDYWGYMSKTMESFRVALEKNRPGLSVP